MKKILFICSGNYYRSRFAEEYFNHLSQSYGLNWNADSKGLSENMPSPNNPGPISVHTLQALQDKGIAGKSIHRFPQPIEQVDFDTSDVIIALSELEHKPMLIKKFNHQLDKILFFEVGDLPVESPKIAIDKIANHVDSLVNTLI